MRVNRAKRRLLRWMRYVEKTDSRTSNRRWRPYHQGHVKAFSDVTFAHTWPPKGIRSPWRQTSQPGGQR